MTKSEKIRIERLQHDIEVLEELWRYEHTNKYSDEEIRRAIADSINSIKKQIPVTIANRPTTCPICKKWGVPYNEHHCRCGQLIDWSEE